MKRERRRGGGWKEEGGGGGGRGGGGGGEGRNQGNIEQGIHQRVQHSMMLLQHDIMATGWLSYGASPPQNPAVSMPSHFQVFAKVRNIHHLLERGGE